jgi:hypothetical protein
MQFDRLAWVLAAIVACLSACAPGLGKTLHVDNIIETSRGEGGAGLSSEVFQVQPKIRVGKVEDRRKYSEVGEIDGRLLQPAGNVAHSVELALQELLRSKDIQPSQFHGKWLMGHILEWRVQIFPGFPTSRVQALAEVKIELEDPSHRRLYSVVYKGTGQAEHPFLTEGGIEDVLGEAMYTALSGAVEDPQLMDKIRE